MARSASSRVVREMNAYLANEVEGARRAVARAGADLVERVAVGGRKFERERVAYLVAVARHDAVLAVKESMDDLMREAFA